jgi:hypothetical protein
MIKDYDFDVKLVPAFIKDAEGKLVQISNRQFVYSDILDNEVYDCVSPQYELIHHKDVVDIVKNELIPALGWKISKENLYLYDKGAILFNMLTIDKTYNLDDLVLHPVVTAVNSYNRVTRAGVHVSLVDSNNNLLVPPSKQIIYVFSGLVHKHGTASISNFKNLANTIPSIINNAIEQWSKWSKDYIQIDRLRIMLQLFNVRLAKNILSTAEYKNITRFGLYQLVCNYILNHENMTKSGFYYMMQVNKILKFIQNDNLFTCSLSELTNYVEKHSKFDWERVNDKSKDSNDIIIDNSKENNNDNKPVLDDILSILNI